jgi:adenylosuccinate synthase
MRVTAVLGSLFGDEGKGQLVSYLAKKDSLVVRFSGGAQAGHTVESPGGRRHVFHQYGSGTLKGAATYLASTTLFDPIALTEEADALQKLVGAELPCIYIDPLCPVVTPYDCMLNQLTESARCVDKHGSCGAGIGEAARRMEETPYKLHVADLSSPLLDAKLASLRDYFEQEMLRRRFDADQSDVHTALFYAMRHFSDAVAQIANSPRHYILLPLQTVLARVEPRTVIAEGSQGVLLDRDMGVFPHVTRAKTGLWNLLPLLSVLNAHRLRVVFVSRCYSTRHGAGPLPLEGPVHGLEPSAKETNKYNQWQGELRYAPFNQALLDWAQQRALAEIPASVIGDARTAITCLDQIDGRIEVGPTGDERSPDWFHSQPELPAPVGFVSYGPTWTDVHDLFQLCST